MTESSEESQLKSALDGNGEAFELLTSPFRRELFVHCYRILGSVEDAEDALQETWIRAWRNLASYESRGTFRAWLYKIATNAALDARSNQRLSTVSTLSFPQADPSQPFTGPAVETAWIEPAPSSTLFATTITPANLGEEIAAIDSFLVFDDRLFNTFQLPLVIG